MWHCFTAAASRALQNATDWSCRADCDELEVVPLLVGLLGESECRAAALLAQCAIDLPALQHRWPTLIQQPSTPPKQAGALKKTFSRDVELSIDLARLRLADLPQPLELATEHLLLGLASADHEAGQWLRQQGIDPDRIEQEIYRQYGGGERREESKEIRESSPSDDVAATSPAILPNSPAYPTTAALRALDAAANRAREGLRVVEDYVRFVLDDRHLTGRCKQLRHDLTAALQSAPTSFRMAARDTEADVGTELFTTAETVRADATAVLHANFARLQESLRSLEEFGKLIDANLSAALKQLRYRTYTLERAVEITRGNAERLADARLYVLVDGRPSLDEFERLIRDLIAAGVDMIQLRDKRLDDRRLLERARLLVALTRDAHVLTIVNDRPDLAALSGADGVHVGQEELSVKDARQIVGPGRWIGVSAHSIEQARQAVLDGADYLGVGPTFPSGTKPFEHFPGVDLLRAVASEIRLPTFAIGGIDSKNIEEVLAAGMTRVAVGGAIVGAADPAAAARELKSRITRAV
ncbi:MAG: thiamine phosphate synthase [Thermoguttaceae bacterium]